ncbi:hypothetical protein G6F22_013786 [Rhizopus arrhizus]|nr:hypothetical protein G6F22_013786 [Rhizopus arrhizus]
MPRTAAYRDIDDVGVAVEVHVPDLFGQRGARQHLALAAQQQRQQAEFLGGQVQPAAAALGAPARRDNEARDEQRLRQEAAYRFMSSMAGNLASFEDATRALYADDRERFAQCIATWPQDVRAYAMGLAWPAPD